MDSVIALSSLCWRSSIISFRPHLIVRCHANKNDAMLHNARVKSNNYTAPCSSVFSTTLCFRRSLHHWRWKVVRKYKHSLIAKLTWHRSTDRVYSAHITCCQAASRPCFITYSLASQRHSIGPAVPWPETTVIHADMFTGNSLKRVNRSCRIDYE